MPNSDHSQHVRDKIRQIEAHRDAAISRAHMIAAIEIEFWDQDEPTLERSAECKRKTEIAMNIAAQEIDVANREFFRSEGYHAGPFSTDEEVTQ